MEIIVKYGKSTSRYRILQKCGGIASNEEAGLHFCKIAMAYGRFVLKGKCREAHAAALHHSRNFIEFHAVYRLDRSRPARIQRTVTVILPFFV